MYINKLSSTMNKKILSLAAVALIAMGANAQSYSEYSESSNVQTETTTSSDKYKVETNHFWNNWFITVGGGGQIFFGDLDKYMEIGDRITPTLDISVGKWFTPGFGLQASYSGLKLKGIARPDLTGAKFKNGKTVPTSDLRDSYVKDVTKASPFEQDAKYFNLHLDGMLNLSNLLCGYSETRVWNVIPYAGVGLARTFDHDGERGNTISFNGGLINKFRLGSRVDLNLTIKGAILDDKFDGEVSEPGENNSFDGQLGATLGLTFKLGKQGWNRSTSTTTIINNDAEVNRLNSELNNLRAENNRLKNAPKGEKVVTFPYLVNFVRNKVDVVNRELVNLKSVAEMIKATPNKKYSVIGYADKQTGTADRNVWLADNRAKNVYDILVNEFNVNPNQLVLDSKGGVDYMFYNDNQLSRSVIISEVK